MKALRYILVATFLLALSLLAAEKWEVDSDIMFNLTQSQFSDNWTGSELSNITWTATSNTAAQKQLKEWLKNRTTLKLAFGQTHLQKKNALGQRYWQAPDKSTDIIDLETVMQFTLKAFVDPYVAGRAESQFLDETAAPTYFVNPVRFTESAGIMKSIIDTEATKLNVRLGGAVRENWDRRADGIPIDGGIEGIAEFKHGFTVLNASYNSKLTAYKALFNSKADELLPNEDWKALDYKWENILSFKLWKLVGLNLNFDVVYDKELVDEVQWKEILGIGFSYALF
jgi:hypothetical protein